MLKKYYAVLPEEYEGGDTYNDYVISTHGWWVISYDEEGYNTVDESGDGGFEEETAKSIVAQLDIANEAIDVLKLYEDWQQLPVDRGGKNGAKGKAFTAFDEARKKVMAKANG